MFKIEEYADLTKAMKSADTTAENKATPWARVTLDGIMAGKLTIATMTQALCAAYKPKTAGGKDATTIGALPDMPRKRATDIKYIVGQLWTAEQERTATYDVVRPLVDTFIAANNYKSSLSALLRAVKAAVKEAGKALAGDDEEDNANDTSSDDATAPVTPDTASDTLVKVAAFIRGLSVEEIEANQETLADILAAVGEASQKLTAETDVKLAA